MLCILSGAQKFSSRLTFEVASYYLQKQQKFILKLSQYTIRDWIWQQPALTHTITGHFLLAMYACINA